VECKLRCVNFRRVSDRRRAFLLACRVTGSAQRQAWKHLGAPATNVGAPATNLGAPASCLGAPRITVEQSGKNNIFFGNAAVRLEIIATTYRSTIVKTHVFSLYSHLCIYVSIKLPIYTRYIWTGCRRCLSDLRHA